MSQYKQLSDDSLEYLILSVDGGVVKYFCVIIFMFSEGLNIEIGVALCDRLIKRVICS